MTRSESMRTRYWRENSFEDVKEENRRLMNRILDYKAEGLFDEEIAKRLRISIRKVRELKKQANWVEPKVMSKEDFINWACKTGLISK